MRAAQVYVLTVALGLIPAGTKTDPIAWTGGELAFAYFTPPAGTFAYSSSNEFGDRASLASTPRAAP